MFTSKKAAEKKMEPEETAGETAEAPEVATEEVDTLQSVDSMDQALEHTTQKMTPEQLTGGGVLDAREKPTLEMAEKVLSGAAVVEVPQLTYPWQAFKPSIFFACFNVALQLVLLGGGGSFLFGFSLAGLNTATKAIYGSFLQCGRDGDVWARFDGIPLGELETTFVLIPFVNFFLFQFVHVFLIV